MMELAYMLALEPSGHNALAGSTPATCTTVPDTPIKEAYQVGALSGCVGNPVIQAALEAGVCKFESCLPDLLTD